MTDRTRYWLELAEYDLETARAMLATKRLLYVGFMCHQVVEKALKAAVTAKGSDPPYIHGLGRLAVAAGVFGLMTVEQKDILDALEPLNIQARYPEHKDRILKTLSEKSCARLLEQTEAVYEWIKATL